MTNEIEHSGVVALGDGREVILDACIAAADEAYNSGPDESAFRRAIMAAVDLAFSDLARPAQEPVVKRWLVEETLQGGSIRWKAYEHEQISRMAAASDNKILTPLYAAPHPVINPTHSQVAGTPGLLTVTAPSDNLVGDNQPRYTTKRLHDEIDKARAYGLEMAAQLIDDTARAGASHYDELARRIRALAASEGSAE